MKVKGQIILVIEVDLPQSAVWTENEKEALIGAEENAVAALATKRYQDGQTCAGYPVKVLESMSVVL